MREFGTLKRRWFLEALGTSSLGSILVGCLGDGGGPSPVPTPAPTPIGTPTSLPSGIPNATMLQNLGLVSQLARGYRPNSYLVRIESSGVRLTGRSDDAIRYIFAYPGGRLEDYWAVDPDGRLHYSENPHILRYDTASDLAPALSVDSPAAVAASLSYGFNRCVQLFPNSNWSFQVAYDSQAGTPTIRMRLFGTGSEVFGDVFISPQTGALLFRDVFEKCG